MNKVIIRTYCEAGCDCPTCHNLDDDGQNSTKVEECVYCQLKWAGCGQYNPKDPVYKRNPPREKVWCPCGNFIDKKDY